MPGRNAGNTNMQFQAQSQQSPLQPQPKPGFQHNMQLMQQRFSAQGGTSSSFPPASAPGVPASPSGNTQQQQQQRLMQQRQLQLQKLHQQKSHLTQPQQHQQQKSLQQQAQAQQKFNQAGGVRGSIPSNSLSAPSPASLPRPSALPPAPSSNSTNSTFNPMPSPSNNKGKSRPSSLQASPSQQSTKSSASPVIKAASPSGKMGTAAASRPPPLTAAVSTASIPPATSDGADKCSPEMTEELLSKCQWNDKCMWVSRQILGGNATNGFLRATATVQRIKRQRARQSAQSKQKSGGSTVPSTSAATPAGGAEQDSKDGNAGKKREADQAAEELLKKEVMNPRTAKKIKSELQLGLSFCVMVHNTIRSILFEMDNNLLPHLPPALKGDDENTNRPNVPMSSAGTETATSSATASAMSVTKPTTATASTATAAATAIAAASAVATGASAAPSAVAASAASTAAASASAVSSASAPPAVAVAPLTHPSSASSTAPNSGRLMKGAVNAPGVGLPAPPLFLAGGNKKGNINNNNNTSTNKPPAANLQQRRGSDLSVASTSSSVAPTPAPVPASPGNPSGSSLRKHRKKKLPPSNEPPIKLNEFGDFGKRLFPKKEHNVRLFEAQRFRALKQGDIVAARLSSRDLWILARVLKEYPGYSVPPAEFLKLSEARRDNLFKDKVCIKDVEDKSNGASTMVARNLVLPLPRSFSEAAEWCARYKKGARVYAMYPQTTSLYAATIADCTTFCRDDDDIIVVEFDGEDPDNKGNLPKYHIPARFVIMIPREFPASQTTTKAKRGKNASGLNTPLLPSSAAGGGLRTGAPAAMVLPSVPKSATATMTATTGATASATTTTSSSRSSSFNKKQGGLTGNSTGVNNNNNSKNSNNKTNKAQKFRNSKNSSEQFSMDLDDGLSNLVGEIPFGDLTSESLENLGELDFDFGDSKNNLNNSFSSFTGGS